MSRDLALEIWCAVALGLVSCVVLARVTGGRYATLRRVLHLLTATRPRTAISAKAPAVAASPPVLNGRLPAANQA